MKTISSLEVIENPQFIKEVLMPSLGGAVSLYEDGSIFNSKTGQFYAPEKDDAVEWQMRKAFDARKAICPGDRYAASHRERSHSMSRYGMVA